MQVKVAVKKLTQKVSLSRDEMRGCMKEIMEGGADDILISAFLTALKMKGESVDEFTAAAEIMREKVMRVESSAAKLIDTCGTGGDGSSTFNISTCSALIAAGAGANVAKHGNRSVSSSCGSADVLQALGVNIEADNVSLGKLLDKAGIAFLFAPMLHPAMKYVMPVRKTLGIRTMFNLLGPLTNPAGARRQLMGVYDKGLVEPIAMTLKELGAVRAFVVHSEDGMDELSISAPTHVGEINNGEIKFYDVKAEDFGLKSAPIEELKTDGIDENKNVIMDILSGVKSAKRDAAVLNAAFAICAGDLCDDAAEGVELAIKAIDSGAAMEKLNELKATSNSF